MRPYRWRLALVLAISLTSTVGALFIPYLSRMLVDRGLLGRDVEALGRTILLFGALTLGSFVLNVVSGLIYTRASAEILFDMRLELFRHLQNLSPRFYAAMPIGQVAARINADMAEIQRVAAEIALAWVGNALFLVGTVLILLRLDAVLFAITLVMVPPALWALFAYRRRLESGVADMRDRSADIGSFLIESLQGMKVVVASNAQEREALRFRTRSEGFITSLMKMRRLTYLAGGLPGLLLAAGSGLVFYVGGRRVIDDTITMGTLVAFVAYQVRLLGPIQALMGLITSITTARVSLRRVNELFDARPDVEDVPGAEPMPSARGDLRLEGVRFGFGRGGLVLDGVTLDVGAGECVALVGRSGEGKSTIADLLARHVDPAEGRVLLDGRDLRAVPLADTRRHVAVVDQDLFIFNASLAGNLRLARPEATDSELMTAIHAAGLDALLGRLPDGIATSLGERGRALSAGERQRVAIARALLADPAVLVLDEATGSLDPATEAEVLAGYEALMRGRTTVLITHRMELARRADRVIVLDRGRIVESGTAAELLAADAAFAEIFDVPVPGRAVAAR
ncbi:MAG TPA: ABC transporter ATP-binding protein [Gemmatimonas sp.]|nr:ABC transporter ATP-binding protein [Gemmatimonas sp.]